MRETNETNAGGKTRSKDFSTKTEMNIAVETKTKRVYLFIRQNIVEKHSNKGTALSTFMM